jgi:DNA modification methylase
MKKTKLTSNNQTLCGDSLDILKTLPSASVQCVVTSPPYWGLRDYGFKGQIGLEKTPEEYVQHLVSILHELKRVLRDDGILWLNLGDCYAANGISGLDVQGKTSTIGKANPRSHQKKIVPKGLKQKDLVGIPWRVAFALQADGWYLRSDIIWAKPNPMPESVTDRPTRSHEYIFLLTKSKKYYYDAETIKEPLAASSVQRLSQPTFDAQTGGEKDYGPTSNRSARKTLVNLKKHYCGPNSRANVDRVPSQTLKQDLIAKGTYVGFNDRYVPVTKRNKRDVWTIAVKPYMGAHFATFPEKLVEPCVLAGSKPGDVVMDPFAGSGTTLAVALRLERHYLGIEGNPKYMKLIRERIKKVLNEKKN